MALPISGAVQVYLWRIVGLDFMTVRTQNISFWIFFVWLFGLTLFLPGATLYLLGFFGMKEEPVAERVAVSTQARGSSSDGASHEMSFGQGF